MTFTNVFEAFDKQGPCFWRQSGGCTWDGPREEIYDRGCCDTISDGWSGYCECANGTKTMKKVVRTEHLPHVKKLVKMKLSAVSCCLDY